MAKTHQNSIQSTTNYNHDYDEIILPSSSSGIVNPKLSMYRQTPINSRVANKTFSNSVPERANHLISQHTSSFTTKNEPEHEVILQVALPLSPSDFASPSVPIFFLNYCSRYECI